MPSINGTQVLRDDLLQQLLHLFNAETEEDLARTILEMDPEDVTAAIDPEDEDLENLVLDLLDNFLRRSLPRQAHVVDSDGELVPLTPSSSDEEPKDTRGRGGTPDSNTSASSSRTIQNQDPQATNNAPRQGNKEGPAEVTRAPASPASQKEVSTRVPKKTHRGTRGAAAGHSAGAVETEAPASMPLMEAVRPAEPARGDQQSARGAQTTRQGTRQQPASTGAQLDDKDLGFVCLLGFCCGIVFTGSWMLVH